MRWLVAAMLGFMATAAQAQAQAGWEPPLDKPADLRAARAFHVAGGAVPLFRDGASALDAWFLAGRHGFEVPESLVAKVTCTVPNNSALTVARLMRNAEGVALFAIAEASGIRGCRGVMYYRDLREEGR